MPSRPEPAHEIRASGLPHRKGCREPSAHDRACGDEDRRAEVDRRLQPVHIGKQQDLRRPGAEHCNQQSDDRPAQRQQRAFCGLFEDETAAAAAKRQPDREVIVMSKRACEKQVRDVGERNQQDEQRDAANERRNPQIAGCGCTADGIQRRELDPCLGSASGSLAYPWR